MKTIETCQHHFVYPMPDGEFSTGTCKKCGETRVSRNWEPDSTTTMYSKQNGGKNKKVWNNIPLSPSTEARPLQVFKPEGRTTTGRSRCTEPGCNEVIRGRGLCNKHYKRVMKAEKR